MSCPARSTSSSAGEHHGLPPRRALPVYNIHGADYDLTVPPQLPGLVSAYVTMHDRVKRRAQALAVKTELVRLRQPVDVARFTPRASLREPPRRVLALGSYLSGDRARVIDDACAQAGIEVVHVGIQHGDQVLETGHLLNERLEARAAPVDAPLRELGRLVRGQWQIEERAMSLASEARAVRDDNERLRRRVDELEPVAARVPELERSVGELHRALRDLLSQRRVRFGLALARPLDFLRRSRR